MCVLMKYWTEFDYDRLPKLGNQYRRDHKYSPVIASFDLESTNYHNLFAFMYVWQFGIGDQIVFGRTWHELREFLANVKAALHLAVQHKMIVMDHNLKYDFGFFCREVPVDGEIIAKSQHEILMCTVFDGFEFRDSYNYTEKSLDAMGEEFGMPKVRGFDYAKIRHNQTALQPDELDYIERDILILQTYYRRESERYGGIGKIPLTATQKVKRIISQKMTQYDSKSGIMRAMIRKRQLKADDPIDRNVLKMLRCAFFGGFNYCTTMYKNEQIPDVDDWDANSHYIAQILLHEFPRNKFEPIKVPKTRDELNELLKGKGIYHHKAMLITFDAKEIHARVPDIVFLPVYTKNFLNMDIVDRRSMVTRRLTDMDSCSMTLTDIDFRLMFKFYKIDQIKIKCIMGTEYGELPHYITQTCVDLYAEKKAAKAQLGRIQEEREPTAEEQAAYDLIKSYLNRVYGIFVQDPVRTNYVYMDGRIQIDKQNRIKTKKTQFAPVLYQWGVWVASWARYELLTLFSRLCVDKQDGKTGVYNYKVLYCDTDSIKGFDLDTTIIAQYNENVKERVRRFCAHKCIDFNTLNGLGEFERKHYDYFKTIGQKQYAYITPHGDFVYHISGLARPWIDPETNEERSFFSQFDTLAEKMDALDQDLKIPAEQSGLLESIYGGEREPEEVEDYNGDKLEVHVLSYVLLQPKGYKAKEDLVDLIEGADPDRLEMIHRNFGHLFGGEEI